MGPFGMAQAVWHMAGPACLLLPSRGLLFGHDVEPHHGGKQGIGHRLPLTDGPGIQQEREGMAQAVKHGFGVYLCIRHRGMPGGLPCIPGDFLTGDLIGGGHDETSMDIQNSGETGETVKHVQQTRARQGFRCFTFVSLWSVAR